MTVSPPSYRNTSLPLHACSCRCLCQPGARLRASWSIKTSAYQLLCIRSPVGAGSVGPPHPRYLLSACPSSPVKSPPAGELLTSQSSVVRHGWHRSAFVSKHAHLSSRTSIHRYCCSGPALVETLQQDTRLANSLRRHVSTPLATPQRLLGRNA